MADHAAVQAACLWIDCRPDAEKSAEPLPEATNLTEWGPVRRYVHWPSALSQLEGAGEAETAAAYALATNDARKDGPVLVFGREAPNIQGLLEKAGYSNVASAGGVEELSELAAEGRDVSTEHVHFYSRLAVEKTYPLLGGASGVVFVVVMIVGALGHAGLTEKTNYDWIIPGSTPSTRWDGFNDAVEQVDTVRVSADTEVVHPRSKDSPRNSLMVLFETPDGSSIFTPPRIQTICRAEAQILDDPDYQRVCRLEYGDAANYSTTCAPPAGSFVASFYPGSMRDGCPLLSSTWVEQKRATFTDPAWFASTAFFFGRDILQTPGRTSRARSNLVLGGPAEGYNEAVDFSMKDDQQKLVYKPFWDAVEPKIFKHFGISSYTDEATAGDLKVLFWSHGMGANTFDQTVSGDLLFSLGSIMIVMVMLVLHTGSFFLGGWGMLQILMSMPTSLFIYRTVCGIDFVTQLHVLGVYLVLGIGADDLFVFFDAWLQSGYAPPEISRCVLTRMDYAYRRAAGAMFTTSFTTAIAFIATASSPIMPISAFGYYAACTVIMNYVLVMTIFPGLLMVWHKTGSYNCCCCNLPIPGLDSGDHYTESEIAHQGGETANPATKTDEHATDDDIKDDGTHDEMRTLEKFFVTTYTPLMNSPARFGFIGVMSLYFIFSTYYAVQMEPPTKPEQWFPDEHMLTKFGLAMETYVGGDATNYVWDAVVWGVDSVDRDGMNPWVPKYRGRAKFDDSFDMSSAAAQQHFLTTCQRLRVELCSVEGCMDGTGKLARPGEVQCFLEDYRTWYRVQQCGACEDDPVAPFVQQGSSCSLQLAQPGTSCSTDLSVVHATSTPGVATLGDHCRASCGFCNVTSTTNCASTIAYPTGSAFVSSLAQFRRDPVYYKEYGDHIGIINGQLKFAAIWWQTTLQHDQAQSMTRTVYDKLEALVDRLNADAPAGMRSAFHCDSGVWAWMESAKALVDNVFTGFKICFPAAFLVLLFSTQNVLTASLAIVTIAGVVACVLGMCKWLMDWGLGVAESIAAVIVIGFSVDFTVHLAHMYSEAGHVEGLRLRSERMASSARTMGVTVTMGAITTLGSGCMLWMCTLTFFTKFAVLIISTICFSLAAALCFFMPLIATVGPENDMGDIIALYNRLTGTDVDGNGPQSANAAAEQTTNPVAADDLEAKQELADT